MAASQDRINVGKMFVIGAAGLTLTYAIVVLVQALYYSGLDAEQQRKLIAVPYTDALESKAQGAEHLAGFGWVDKEAGRVHIPIEDAKSAFLENPR